jgi:hypothetical protein
MDDTGGNLGMWGTIGAGIAAAIAGALAWLTGRQRRQAEEYGYGADAAGYKAEKDIIENLRAEVARLSERVQALETDGLRMRSRVWHLEDELRKHGIPVPPIGGPVPQAAP